MQVLQCSLQNLDCCNQQDPRAKLDLTFFLNIVFFSNSFYSINFTMIIGVFVHEDVFLLAVCLHFK